MYYLYIIESSQKKWFYVGITNNVDGRLSHHNKGSNKSTKPYRPYKLIYLEKIRTKAKALRREKKLKSFKGGEALKKLIESWGAGVDNRSGL